MNKFKTTLCALAVMAAATTGANASAKCPLPAQMTKFENDSFKTNAARNELENFEYQVQTNGNDAKCIAEHRDRLTKWYLPILQTLYSEQIEPTAKMKIAPMISDYQSALEPGLTLEELNKRIDSFYAALSSYRQYAFKSEWHYSSQRDEMRGETIHYWSLKSSDVKKLDAPYKAAHAIILVYQKEVNGVVSEPQSMLYVDDGQLNVSGFNSEDLPAKFGDNKVITFAVKGCGDENKAICFSGDFSNVGFIYYVRTANKAIVEIPFYQAGRYQFHFNTGGLTLLRVTPDIQKPKEKK